VTQITFLGTCSGTEPMPDRKHVSFVIEQDEQVYWFDAGECCSRTAHLMGIDLLSVRAIFISHPHMDHIGGLPNLVWTMAKLDSRNQDPTRSLKGKHVDLFIPDLSVWHGIHGMFSLRSFPFDLAVKRCEDGVIYDDSILRVTALHNKHIGEPAPGDPWRSFSLRIEAGDKRIVYSGDVAHVSEIQPLLAGCDLFLMETGHHRVEEICHYLRDNDLKVGQLAFIHHGRAILADAEGEAEKARAILGRDVLITDDGMSLSL
jgi:ribonuclease BN (tRNA processing enzyme)